MSLEQRPILILEERASGHLLVYVRIIAQRARERGNRVILGLPKATMQSREYNHHLLPIAHMVTIVHIPPRLSVSSVRQLAEQTQAQVVIVPHGDVLACKIALHRQIRHFTLVVLAMRDPRWERPTRFSRSLKNYTKLWALKLAERRRNVRLIWLREPQYVGNSAERFAIDPFIADGTLEEIDAGARALRTDWAMDGSTYWFGVTGAISSRKNVPLILSALKKATFHASRPLGLALVGPIAADVGFSVGEVRARCKEAGIKLILHDRVLTNFEMNCVVRAVDSVVMAYSTHSPNSTLGKAYVLGTQLVAAGSPSIRRFVQGLGFDLHSELSVAALAENLLRASERHRPECHENVASEGAFADSLLDTDHQV